MRFLKPSVLRQSRNASDVLRAGWRALEREDIGAAWRDWHEAEASLLQDPITPDIEQKVEQRIRTARRAGVRSEVTVN